MASASGTRLTIVGVGAHMDDCWLGFGATALKALKRGHRVVFVTAISNPRHLPYLAGRDTEIAEFLSQQSREVGIEYVRLGHDYMRLDHTPALVEQVAKVLAEHKADIVFCHDPNESNQDHVALGQATMVAARHTECFLPPAALHEPREIYRFTTGWQSYGFVPNVCVDVSDTLFDMLPYASSFDVLYAKGRWPTKHTTVTDHVSQNGRTIELTGHSQFKYAQAVMTAAGHGYAEGFISVRQPFLGSLLARACGYGAGA
jgi:LmbE family N-acetylglucosaminyl deacetylase